MLLENLKLIIFCPTLSNGAFRYDLFKMKTDCPSFEEFEKLFNEQFENEAGDVAVPEKPEHKVEWSRCCDVSFIFSSIVIFSLLFIKNISTTMFRNSYCMHVRQEFLLLLLISFNL